jgi:formylglycine-generating enzyme required for sulfatase activity
MLLGSQSLCVDIYEASASEMCPHQVIDSQNKTQDNANSAQCTVVSKQDAVPWNFVSQIQAQQFCGKVGKRLPSNEEWYKIANGFNNETSCVIDSGSSAPSPTGTKGCVTPSLIYDVVGNVWEWIDEEVTAGVYNNRVVPPSGYVSSVDTNGITTQTQDAPLDEFGSDYAQTSSDGIKGIIRGGFYGSKSDAGIFAQNLSVPLDFKSAGVGFRCVKTVQ